MRMIPVWLLGLSLATALLVVGCGASAGANGKRTVVAAFYPLAFAAEEIGGRNVHVENLTPPGAEPHDIELTPQEVARLQRRRTSCSTSRTGSSRPWSRPSRGRKGD